MEKLNTKILDCTFRDGGYYNNWDFDKELVKKYLKVMPKVVDAIEIGFRSVGKNNFANVTDDFDRPAIEHFGVMINTGEEMPPFHYADKSPFDFVRVATHFKDLDQGENRCK